MVRSNFKRLAKLVVKDIHLKAHVIKYVADELKTECAHLCSKKNPSILRNVDHNAIVEFSFDKVVKEWTERAPIFLKMLSSICMKKEYQNASALHPALVISGATLLRRRNQHMSALHHIMGQILNQGCAKIEVIIIQLTVHVIFTVEPSCDSSYLSSETQLLNVTIAVALKSYERSVSLQAR